MLTMLTLYITICNAYFSIFRYVRLTLLILILRFILFIAVSKAYFVYRVFERYSTGYVIWVDYI